VDFACLVNGRIIKGRASKAVGEFQSVAFEIEEFVMRERIEFLLIVLSLSLYACAQEGTVEHGWTDKNNTEM
jgi:hypothetical protein